MFLWACVVAINDVVNLGWVFEIRSSDISSVVIDFLMNLFCNPDIIPLLFTIC